MISVVSVASWYVLPPLEMQWYGQSVLATMLFVSNFYFLFRGNDYFAGITEEYPLLHTWSLAVEEQFYIFFPILLWLLWRFGPKRVFWVIAGIAAASLAFAEVFGRVNFGANFYLLPSRAWELAAGALVAFAHFRKAPQANEALSLLGFAMILGSIPFLREGMNMPGLLTVPAVLGTALVLWTCTGETIAGRILSWKPFVWIGLASYSAYLWHQPLFALVRVRFGHDLPLSLMLALSVLSIILGWLSLKFVEAPFRKRGGSSSIRVLGYSAVAMSVMIAFGAFLHQSLGASFRTAPGHLHPAYYQLAAKPNFPAFGVDGKNCAEGCSLHVAENPSEHLLLVGDSHAQDLLIPMQQAAAAEGFSVSAFVNTGCTYTRFSDTNPACAAARQRLEALSGEGGFDRVIMINRFSATFFDTPESIVRESLSDYGRTIDSFADSGAVVDVVLPRLQLDLDPIRAGVQNKIDEISVLDQFHLTDAWSDLQSRYDGVAQVRFFDQNEMILGLGCGQSACFDGHSEDRAPLLRDPHHLAISVAERLVDALTQGAAVN